MNLEAVKDFDFGWLALGQRDRAVYFLNHSQRFWLEDKYLGHSNIIKIKPEWRSLKSAVCGVC